MGHKAQSEHLNNLMQDAIIQAEYAQKEASDPLTNAWVSASAGTGKTTVLTRRVLRLMLPHLDPETQKFHKGTPPYRLLCLTFTKAGASEMAIRIHKILARWAVMDESDLKKTLEKLTGDSPTAEQIIRARQLFAELVDAAGGGMKIMTIHSFCHSVLSRFPLEAGVPIQFDLIEGDKEKSLIHTAIDSVLNAPEHQKSVEILSHEIAYDQIQKDLTSLIAERHRLQKMLDYYQGYEGWKEWLAKDLKIHPDQDPDTLLMQYTQEGNFNRIGLKNVMQVLYDDGGEKNTQQAQGIDNFLSCTDISQRIKLWPDYVYTILTKDKTLRKPLKAIKERPELQRILEDEGNRILSYFHDLNQYSLFHHTCHMVILGQKSIAAYTQLKDQKGVLDNNDLILKTLDLVQGNLYTPHHQNSKSAAQWVLYKLDQSIDHILVDEAQDTNPEQWALITALADDFFAGDGTRPDEYRTLFVVGDEKQSIYRFQRADPIEFSDKRDFFRKRSIDAQRPWRDVALQTSFRSTGAVLSIVDHLFNTEEMRRRIGMSVNDHLQHKVARAHHAGKVVLWPLFQTAKTNPDDLTAFNPKENSAYHNAQHNNGMMALSQHIATNIRAWLDSGEKIFDPHEKIMRPIKAGDIMILLRSRNALFHQIPKSLIAQQIPVSGLDRVVLKKHIIVQDILACLQFSLLPDDDLNLAILLKTPFLGWNDQQIFDVLYAQSTDQPIHHSTISLWQKIKAHKDDPFIAKTIEWLRNLFNLAHHARPYDFIAHILSNPCPTDSNAARSFFARFGMDSADITGLLLNNALRYEQDYIPTLQGFLAWQKNNEAEFKRIANEDYNQVRIMTIHGSKGLEAPIVILPDTILHKPPKTQYGMWTKTAHHAAFLWHRDQILPKESDNPYRKAKTDFQAAESDESMRLLYVAMTRARDHLYIGGYTGKKTPLENSPYFTLQNAFQDHPDHKILENGDYIMADSGEMIEKNNPNLHADPILKTENAILLPDWVTKIAATEDMPPRPLTPSRAQDDEAEIKARSPLQDRQKPWFARGIATHRLLQYLPDTPNTQWADLGALILKQYHSDLSETIRQQILDETLKILHHADFNHVFQTGSQAEVPISGIVENRIINGQIDRLMITDTMIYIVDYKTNRPSPTSWDHVPAAYKTQLLSYQSILSQLYPQHSIKCALIWTDEARLMVMPS